MEVKRDRILRGIKYAPIGWTIWAFVRCWVAWMLYGYFREAYSWPVPDFGYWELFGLFMLLSIIGAEFTESICLRLFEIRQLLQLDILSKNK